MHMILISFRTCDEVVEIARRRPFEEKEIAAASTFCIGFLRDPLDAPSKKKLM